MFGICSSRSSRFSTNSTPTYSRNRRTNRPISSNSVTYFTRPLPTCSIEPRQTTGAPSTSRGSIQTRTIKALEFSSGGTLSLLTGTNRRRHFFADRLLWIGADRGQGHCSRSQSPHRHRSVTGLSPSRPGLPRPGRYFPAVCLPRPDCAWRFPVPGAAGQAPVSARRPGRRAVDVPWR